MTQQKHLLQIYHTYQRQLFVYVNRQLHDPQTAEEIVQDVFMAYAEAVRIKTTVKSISAFLYAIARHKIIDYMRKKGLKTLLFSRLPKQMNDVCSLLLSHEHLQKKDLEDSIYRTLSRLPDDYAVIIRLKYIEGFSVKSIAKKLTKRFKTVESLLFRAKKAFIKIYKSQNTT